MATRDATQSDINDAATQTAPFPTSSDTAAGSGIASSTAASNEVLARVVQGAHETIDRLAERAGPAIQRLQDGVTNANDTLHKRADAVRETGGEWTESLRCTVRDNPLAAVATALAVGILIARLTR